MDDLDQAFDDVRMAYAAGLTSGAGEGILSDVHARLRELERDRARIWNEAIEAAASVLTDQDAENVLSLRVEQAIEA